jgi:hypothetical protein
MTSGNLGAAANAAGFNAMDGQAVFGVHLHTLSSGGARLLLLARTTYPRNRIWKPPGPKNFSDFQFCAVRVWRKGSGVAVGQLRLI